MKISPRVSTSIFSSKLATVRRIVDVEMTGRIFFISECQFLLFAKYAWKKSIRWSVVDSVTIVDDES